MKSKLTSLSLQTPIERLFETSEEVIGSLVVSNEEFSADSMPIEDRISQFLQRYPIHAFQMCLVIYFLAITAFRSTNYKQLQLRLRHQKGIVALLFYLLDVWNSLAIPSQMLFEKTQASALNGQLVQLLKLPTTRHLHFLLLLSLFGWDAKLLDPWKVVAMSLIPSSLLFLEYIASLLFPKIVQNWFSGSPTTSRAETTIGSKKRKNGLPKDAKFRKVKEEIRKFQEGSIRFLYEAANQLLAFLQLWFVLTCLPRRAQRSIRGESQPPSLSDYLVTVGEVLLLGQFLIFHTRLLWQSLGFSSDSDGDIVRDTVKEKKKKDPRRGRKQGKHKKKTPSSDVNNSNNNSTSSGDISNDSEDSSRSSEGSSTLPQSQDEYPPPTTTGSDRDVTKAREREEDS